jgi:hypothetical protein
VQIGRGGGWKLFMMRNGADKEWEIHKGWVGRLLEG